MSERVKKVRSLHWEWYDNISCKFSATYINLNLTNNCQKLNLAFISVFSIEIVIFDV